MLTYTEQAALAVAGPNVRAAAGEPWDDWLEIIRQLVAQLRDLCQPYASGGYRYLTEEYGWWERLWGAGRRRDRAIRRAVAEAGGDPEDADAVIAALAAGKLTEPLMAGLYRECR